MTREEAIKWQETFRKTYGIMPEAAEACDMAIKALQEPERKRGRWIHDGQRIEGGVDWWHCSECISPESGVYAKMPYCAKCGAYMGDESE